MKYAVSELKEILKNLNTFYNVDSVGDDVDLFSQGLLDSLILIQFVMAIENRYKIQIQNQDINYESFKNFLTIQRILNSNYSR